jgi:hypothetical protein
MKRPVRLRTTDRYGSQMIEPLDEFGQRMLGYEAWVRRQRWYRRFWIWFNSEARS